jgi:hypothetical protein
LPPAAFKAFKAFGTDPIKRGKQVSVDQPPFNSGLRTNNTMSSINSTSATSNSAAMYQEYLARLQIQKQTTGPGAQPTTAKPAPVATGDVDHDGDSH